MDFKVKFPGTDLYPGEGTHWWENITTEEMVRIAQTLDELGYDYIMVPDHIVMNTEWATFMGPRWAHSMTASAFLLGATKRIKLIPLILTAMYNPIELAKSIATVDFMSGGRLRPTTLAGYYEWEFNLLGAPFADRGAALNEYIPAMKVLWESDGRAVEFHGDYVDFEDVIFDPRPVQKPMPMWFGGRDNPALRRLAHQGEGWISSMVSRERLPETMAYIHSHQETPHPIELYMPLFEGTWHPEEHWVIEPAKIRFEKDAILEQVQKLADLGVTLTDAQELLGFGRWYRDTPDSPAPIKNLDELLERAQWFAEEIMPDAKRITAVSQI